MQATCNQGTDRDYERIFVGDKQINITHFYAINWTKDSVRPIKFSFGYWTHDGRYFTGTVKYSNGDFYGFNPVVEA